MSISLPIRGRGASDNPPNRFEPIYIPRDPEYIDPEDPAPTTLFYRDVAKTIFSKNDSPDIPFRYHVNPYRGCEHGCIYCYARPTHEYMGFSAGLDFETRIFVKEDAPELIRKELSSRKWEPQAVGISGVTDCYQPVERKLQITRRCLQEFLAFRNPVAIVTKNALIERDVDLLQELAQFQAVSVMLSVTSLDADLARVLEPRASTPAARLRAIETLHQAGVPVGVLVAPIIPGLNDHEAGPILQAVASAGASSAGYVMIHLPFATKQLFQDWLEQHFPGRKEKVLQRIREVQGENLHAGDFGLRMSGAGKWAEMFRQIFRMARQKAGIPNHFPELSTAHFRNPYRLTQRSLFD